MGSTRFATGQEPEAVAAQIRWENDVDVMARVQAQFQGFSYHSYTCIRAHPWQQVVFHGEKGVLRLTAPFNPQVFGEARIEIMQQNHGVRVESFPAARHYVLQVEAFGRSIAEGEDYPVPLEFSKGTQQMMDQVFSVAKPL